MVVGEETVLLHAIENKRAQPDQRPPYPTVLWFNSSAIVTALTGHTLTAVDAWIYVSQRGGSGTGTVPVGYFRSNSTTRTTYASVSGKSENRVRRPAGFSEGSGQWVSLSTTGWAAGTVTGLLLGPGQTALSVLSRDAAAARLSLELLHRNGFSGWRC